MKSLVLLAGVVLLTVTPSAQQPSSTVSPALKTEVSDGGSVITELGYGIKLNKASTLHRAFVTINDPQCPAQLTAAGISSKFDGRGSSYSFAPVGTPTPAEPITALEARFVLFDSFGGRFKALSATEIADFAAQATVSLALHCQVGAERLY